MSKKLNGLLVILGGLFVSGCNSGTSTQGSGGGQPISPDLNESAIVGLINYEELDALLNTTLYGNDVVANASSSSISTQAVAEDGTFYFDNSVCTSLMTNPKIHWYGQVKKATGRLVMDGLVKFIPEVGKPLKFAGSSVKKGMGLYHTIEDAGKLNRTGSCITSLEDQIAEQLNYMSGQIAQLQYDYADLDNEFYKNKFETSLTVAGLYNQNLREAYKYIDGVNQDGEKVFNGLFQQFMNASGMWVNGVPQKNIKIQDVTRLVFPRLEVSIISLTSTQNFQSAVQNISGSNLNVNCTENCFNQVQQSNSSALNQTYQHLYQTYLAAMDAVDEKNKNADTTGDALVNAVDLIDNYNNAVVSIYYQSVLALQQAYTMEWAINKFNFAAYDTNALPEISVPSLGQVNGTYYNYNTVMRSISDSTADDHVDAYNKAQIELVKLYAARFNALYINTIEYLVTDKPQLMQQPFVESGADFYAQYDGQVNVFKKYKVSDSVAARMNNAFMTSLAKKTQAPLDRVPGSAYKSNAILYQFGGLNSLSECLQAMQEFNLNPAQYGNDISNAVNDSTCPLVYADINESALNKASYRATHDVNVYLYNENQVQKPILAMPVQNNIAACNIGTAFTSSEPFGDLYFWTAKSGNENLSRTSPYLTCNYWKNNPNKVGGGKGYIQNNVKVDHSCNSATSQPSVANYLQSTVQQSCGFTNGYQKTYKGYDWNYGVQITFASYKNAVPMLISSTNSNLFTKGTQNSSAIDWYKTGYNTQNGEWGIAAVYEFGKNSAANVEEYLTMQFKLTNMNNLVVPFNIAVTNISGAAGNYGALLCPTGIVEKVMFTGVDGSKIPLCSNDIHYTAQMFSSSDGTSKFDDNLQVFGVNFLNNSDGHAFITNAGTWNWKVFYGDYSDSQARGVNW